MYMTGSTDGHNPLGLDKKVFTVTAQAHAFPMTYHRDPEGGIPDAFDWYSPWYQSKHIYEEVFRWFVSCGLGSLKTVHKPIAVHGQRPLRCASSERTKQGEINKCVA